MDADWSTLPTFDLIQALLSIILILCERFRVPIPALAPSSTPQGSGLESPYQCDFHCAFCSKRCGRNRPGHSHHSCWEHRHHRG